MDLSFISTAGTKFESPIISGGLTEGFFFVSVFCLLSENPHLAGYQFWGLGTQRQ